MGWPEISLPGSPVPLLDFLTAVHGWNRDTGKIVVHCTDGCSRSGAFIVLDTQVRRLAKYGHVNLFECCLRVTRQRMEVVATEDQYEFLYEALAAAASSV